MFLIQLYPVLQFTIFEFQGQCCGICMHIASFFRYLALFWTILEKKKHTHPSKHLDPWDLLVSYLNLSHIIHFTAVEHSTSKNSSLVQSISCFC